MPMGILTRKAGWPSTEQTTRSISIPTAAIAATANRIVAHMAAMITLA